MLQFNWLTSLTSKLRVASTRCIQAQRKGIRSFRASQALVSNYVAESLEERTLLTAFTVVNTNDAGEGSLREAIEAANANAGADTISFDATLAGQTIVLTNDILISDDLTITGLGADQLTLDGNGDSRIFNIDDGDFNTKINVEISGLTLANGNGYGLTHINGSRYSNFLGGAIYNRESLTVVDSFLRDNQANRGGAIFNDDSELKITNSKFLRNEANFGGAIYNNVANATVTNSTFSENKAAFEGGGIYHSSDDLTINGSIIEHNFANQDGGGIYKSSGQLTVDDSMIAENTANRDGGGIYNRLNNLIVSDTTFYRNEATRNGGGIHGSLFYSTAYYSAPVPIAIGDSSDSSMMLNRQVTVNGYNYTSISNSQFIENSAQSGGGIYKAYSEPSQYWDWCGTRIFVQVTTEFLQSLTETPSPSGFSITDSSFTGNSAQYGGGIYNRGDLLIEGSTISENTANYGGGIYIGGVSVADTLLKIQNSTISGNTARIDGGGIQSGNPSFTYLTPYQTYRGAEPVAVAPAITLRFTGTPIDIGLLVASDQSPLDNVDLVGLEITDSSLSTIESEVAIDSVPSTDSVASFGGCPVYC